MFKVDDTVKVVSDDFNGDDLIDKQGRVVFVSESGVILVLLEDYTPEDIDLVMAEMLGLPVGSVPFDTHELELINV